MAKVTIGEAMEAIKGASPAELEAGIGALLDDCRRVFPARAGTD